MQCQACAPHTLLPPSKSRSQKGLKLMLPLLRGLVVVSCTGFNTPIKLPSGDLANEAWPQARWWVALLLYIPTVAMHVA